MDRAPAYVVPRTQPRLLPALFGPLRQSVEHDPVDLDRRHAGNTKFPAAVDMVAVGRIVPVDRGPEDLAPLDDLQPRDLAGPGERPGSLFDDRRFGAAFE